MRNVRRTRLLAGLLLVIGLGVFSGGATSGSSAPVRFSDGWPRGLLG